MAEQLFPVEAAPRVLLTNIRGSVSVQPWDGQAIKVETDGRMAVSAKEGDALILRDCDSDIELWTPADATIVGIEITDDVDIRGVRRVELRNVYGDVELTDIDIEHATEGTAIEFGNLAADVEVTNAPSVRAHGGIGADATFTRVAVLAIESVGGDLEIREAESVTVGSVGGDCQVQGSAQADVTMGNIGGSLQVSSARNVQLGNVGADCELRDVQGHVEIGHIGADVSFIGIAGNLKMGSIGSDAVLKGMHGAVELGSVGGDLELQADFPAQSHTRINVGGDASVTLPNNPHLNIRATVGGDVHGRAIVSSFHGNMLNLTYGDGLAQLELMVGGDLELNGSSGPRSSSSSSWDDFGRDMADLGREMGRLGQEIGQEIASAFRDTDWSWGSKAGKKAQEQARRAEEQARQRMEREQARVRVRINNREWQMDPERIERIKEQARRAANEGLSGALEAVERALGNIRIPNPPAPPKPPVPPVPPNPMGGQQTQSQSTSAASSSRPPVDLEQERAAILGMIAEGRITPEEGDLLLEALGG